MRHWRLVALLLLVGLAVMLIHRTTNRQRVSAFGGNIYCTKGYNLVRHNLRTGEKNTVLKLREQKASQIIVRSNYAISFDGRTMAYVESRSSRDESFSNHSGVIVVDLQSGRVLYRQKMSALDIPDVVLALSRNGQRLAIKYENRQPTSSLLDVVNVRTGKRIISHWPAYGLLSWHPNGRWLAYQDKWARPVSLDVDSQQVKRYKGQGRPQWSGDGKFLVVGNSNVMSLKSSASRPLRLPARAIVIGWSPDSRGLLYETPSEISGDPIYVYSLDTARSVRLPFEASGVVSEPTLWCR
ncbi:MAG: hypothetical protein ACOX3G_00795 [Armatimonadota bacterium]